MGKLEKFEDLEVWQEAREIVNDVYRACHVERFKREYHLVDQIKRSAALVMANIAEGFSRRGNKEFVQFLFISKASAAELQSHLYIALDQDFLSQDEFDALYERTGKVQRMASNLIKYLKRNELEKR